MPPAARSPRHRAKPHEDHLAREQGGVTSVAFLTAHGWMVQRTRRFLAVVKTSVIDAMWGSSGSKGTGEIDRPRVAPPQLKQGAVAVGNWSSSA